MDQLNPAALILSTDHHQEIISIAERENPLEACGLIAGKGQVSQAVIQIPNVLASRTAYQMSGPELVHALWQIESDGWTLLAFFHSHPHSPPIPSPTDLTEHQYPETPQIIIGMVDQDWQLAAYTLANQAYSEIPILFSGMQPE